MKQASSNSIAKTQSVSVKVVKLTFSNGTISSRFQKVLAGVFPKLAEMSIAL